MEKTLNFNILERFLKYISFETTSDPTSNLHPSNKKEFDLLNYLKKELEDLHLSDIYLSDKGYLYAKLNKNAEGFYSIGFISHVDTSPDFNGANINYQIIKAYDGEKVTLNKEKEIYLDPKEFPFLKDLKGRSLICTDGLSLLGADDKAGVSEIVSVIEYLNNHKDIKHGDIYICFTPDEEIGEGTMFFEKDKFKVDFAYTVDGSIEGEIAYENFNAASANVKVMGKNIHPGSAKDHMINSMLIAMEFNSMLDPDMVPSKTDGYLGFNHLNNMEGSVEETNLSYIIRNHSKEIFEKQKQDFLDIQDKLNKKYGKDLVKVTIKDSYYNMYELVKERMEVVNLAKDAIKMAGLSPVTTPIRGGTDGATLSYKGIICPNLGTGGFNFHGKYECASLEGMMLSAQIIYNIISISKH